MAAVHSHVARRPTRLSASLRSRHVSMIAYGGIFGAGVFVGSGQIIGQAGPAVVLCYLIAGLLAIAVMRMLAALSMDEPATGAFAHYAARAFGWIGGFTIGWLYWWLMMVTVSVECSAAAGIAHTWLPAAPAWLLALVLIAGLTGLNLMPVRAFGEAQFWLSLVKVVVLLAVLVFGALAVFGLLPGVASPGRANLLDLGGFMPHGANAVLTGVLVAVFSFVGLEMIAIAAGETRTGRQAVRGSMSRVLPITAIIYVGVILIVVTMVPWNAAGTEASPVAALLAKLGMRHAAGIVDLLVFLALVTVANSSLYSASRMLFAVSGKDDTPRGLQKLSPAAVPSRAVWLTALFAFGVVAIQEVAPNGVFLVLVDSSGAVGLLVWFAIAAAYLKLRAGRREDLRRPPFFYVAWVVIAVIVIMLIAMAALPDTRSQILATLSLAVIIMVIALWRDTMREAA